MRSIEDVFFRQAELIKDRNVLIICDRGCMDPSAYCPPRDWEKILKELNLTSDDVRCNRYDQIVHLVTAADGAEQYYTQENNASRFEGIEEALKTDQNTRLVCVGHPYVSIIDNFGISSFDEKINKLIQVVSDRAGVEIGDSLTKGSKKRKWLVSSVEFEKLPKFEIFEIENFYLSTDDPRIQIRVRRRSQNGKAIYTITSRETFENKDAVETRRNVPKQVYMDYLNLQDKTRSSIFKQRYCFMHGSLYFKLDIYKTPLPPMANDQALIFLETYTTVSKGEPLLEGSYPSFLTIEKEITGDPKYSMYTLSQKNKQQND